MAELPAPEPGDLLGGASCPLPFRRPDRIVLADGGGGLASAELVERLFRPAFGAAGVDGPLTDAAVLAAVPGRLALTTDSFVVQPLVFPGGDIGDLAVNGTVNDLAVCGAQPLALSAAFVLEEGLELELLERIARSMGAAATAAGTRIVTGDTKVVERGRGDGLHVATTGLGVVSEGVELHPSRSRPGDVVVVSGPIGLHGIAVLSVREGLEFGTEIVSDTTALHGLVAAMLEVTTDLHVMRDLTRGGLAAACCELAEAGGVGLEIEESSVPVPDAVRAACGLFGLDPFVVANEGVLVAFVPPEWADAVVDAMRARPEGRGATVVGRVVADHPGIVVGRTGLGAGRLIDRPLGEQLPRIC